MPVARMQARNFVDGLFVDGSSTFDKVDQKGPKGVYGQQADKVVITDLYQHNYAATAAVFKLPDLHMRFGSKGCPQ